MRYATAQEVNNMNQYVTGEIIKELREKQHLTQTQLAELLCVSNKAISKWETGKGYPDISLLEPLAQTFGISTAELISGVTINNVNVAANMMRSKFYVCPVCGNIIHSTGEALIHCHGITLQPEEAEFSCETHPIHVESIEDEYFVTVNHSMTKQHYISFLAALSCDCVHVVKLYPEGNAQARFKKSGVQVIYAYCNKDGLFYKKL